MAKKSKLNSIGKAVLKAFEDGTKCWSDVEISNIDSGEYYYTFEICQNVIANRIGQAIIEKVSNIANAFEFAGICCCLYGISSKIIRKDVEWSQPYIYVQVSLKDDKDNGK